jgi:hypothetical protein
MNTGDIGPAIGIHVSDNQAGRRMALAKLAALVRRLRS